MIQPSKRFGGIAVASCFMAVLLLAFGMLSTMRSFTRPTVRVSFLNYSNTPNGRVTALFAISNSALVDLNFTVVTPITEDLADSWPFKPRYSPRVRLRPGEMKIVEVIPPRQSDGWCLRVGFEPIPTPVDLLSIRLSRWIPYRLQPELLRRSENIRESPGLYLTNSEEIRP